MNSDEEIWNTTLADFREATASAEPTPGGGSVAAVSGTLGLGLVIMALEISSKRKDATRPEETQALITEARVLMKGLAADADNDVRAFRDYMAALKLPKESEEDKARRKEALQKATRGATEAPLLAARHMVQGLCLAERAEPLAHSHVVSDVGAGTCLLEGALKAVLFNVDVNLPGVTDMEIKGAWEAERAKLAEEEGEIASCILGVIRERLAKRS
jgi:formiminotetrahydrofolate cyclodeaminase